MLSASSSATRPRCWRPCSRAVCTSRRTVIFSASAMPASARVRSTRPSTPPAGRGSRENCRPLAARCASMQERSRLVALWLVRQQPRCGGRPLGHVLPGVERVAAALDDLARRAHEQAPADGLAASCWDRPASRIPPWSASRGRGATTAAMGERTLVEVGARASARRSARARPGPHAIRRRPAVRCAPRAARHRQGRHEPRSPRGNCRRGTLRNIPALERVPQGRRRRSRL